MKKCSRCKLIKSLEDYFKDRARKDGYYLHCKNCHSEYNKKSYRKNKKKINKYRANYHRNKRQTDIYYRLKCNMRTRLYDAIKNNYKSGSAVADLGCTIEQFKLYLESKFQIGMTWHNWGQGQGNWNIDHKIPLCSFNLSNREELLIACNYTNLQPLWSIDNLSKLSSDKKYINK